MSGVFTEKVQELISNSWIEGTKKQYHPYLKPWASYCCHYDLDVYTTSVKHGVEFQAEMFHSSELHYSALNMARSALSLMIILDNGLSFGKQPVVKKLMKGIFRARLSLPCNTITFDVDIVFRHLNCCLD